MKAVRSGAPKNDTDSGDVTLPNRTEIVRGNGGTSAQESPSSSRSTTPVSQSSSSARLSDSHIQENHGRRSRDAARRSQRLIRQVIAGERRPQKSSHKAKAGGATTNATPKSSKKKLASSKKKKLEYEGSSSEEEAVVDYESPESESESSSGSDAAKNKLSLSDVESDLSDAESELSTASSAKHRLNQGKTSRPPTPVWCKEDVKLPELTLPESSNDLLIEQHDIMPALAVYEVLRHFSSQLRLSPFRFEEFCAALCSDEQCALLSESQLCLLKAMIKEEEANGTLYGAHDQRDSINIQHYLMDGMTWMALVHQYIESDKEYQYALPSAEDENFPFVSVSKKLQVLQFLCDQFLSSNKVREEIISEGAITYDDHCRSCHRLGDLICCETCSAVYHLECTDPPLTAIPEDDWLCTICKAHRVPGVYDCISDIEKSGMLIRQEPIGVDRHGRKYWFLCRRIIIESEDHVWYYSTKLQLEELMQCLDPLIWEKDLCLQLSEVMPDILHGMLKTLELTHKHKGSLKSVLELANAEILEVKKAKEDEEKQKKEEEEKLLEEERRLEDEKKLEEERRLEEERLAEEKEQMETEGPPETDNTEKGTEDTGEEGELPGAGVKLEECTEKQDSESPAAKEMDTSQVVNQDGAVKAESSPGETEGSKKGIMTRSRNPNYKPPPPKSTPYVTYSTTMPKQTVTTAGLGGRVLRSTLKDEPAVLVNAKGEKSLVITPARFKLGMEGTYKLYANLFATKRLALNKPQHAEDRDKKRHMANKFGIQSDVSFKWQGTIYGNKLLTISTLRLTITQLESNIPQPFMHTNWPTHRNNWIKAVHMCSKPQAFSLAMSVLECAIKPVVFYPVWNDAIGHTRLKRVSIIDKEERKRAEKRQSDLEDEMRKISPWVKYCFPIKHQIWKHKGEEFRTFFGGGWSWTSSTRKSRPLPPPSPAKIFLDESIRQAEADETNQFRTAMNGYLDTDDDEELPLSQLKKDPRKPQETSPSPVNNSDSQDVEALESTEDQGKIIEEGNIPENTTPKTELVGVVERMEVQQSGEISDTCLQRSNESSQDPTESGKMDVAESEMTTAELSKDDQVSPMEGVETDNSEKVKSNTSTQITSLVENASSIGPDGTSDMLESNVAPGRDKVTSQDSNNDNSISDDNRVADVNINPFQPVESKEGQVKVKVEGMVGVVEDQGKEPKPSPNGAASAGNQTGNVEIKKEEASGKLEKGTDSDSTDSNMEDVVPDSPYQKSYIQLMAKLNKVAGETVNKVKKVPYRDMTTETVDVSAYLQSYPRTFYKVIPYRSRLEGFLERRMKMEAENEEKFKVEQQRYLQYQDMQKKRQDLHEELKKVQAAKERELKKAEAQESKIMVTGTTVEESEPAATRETTGQDGDCVAGPAAKPTLSVDIIDMGGDKQEGDSKLVLVNKPTLPGDSRDATGESGKEGNSEPALVNKPTPLATCENVMVEKTKEVEKAVAEKVVSNSVMPAGAQNVPGLPVDKPFESSIAVPTNEELAESVSRKSPVGTNLIHSFGVAASVEGTDRGDQDVGKDTGPSKPMDGSCLGSDAASRQCATSSEGSKVQEGLEETPAQLEEVPLEVMTTSKPPLTVMQSGDSIDTDRGDKSNLGEVDVLDSDSIKHRVNNHDGTRASPTPQANESKADSNVQEFSQPGSFLLNSGTLELKEPEAVATGLDVVNSKKGMVLKGSPDSGILGRSDTASSNVAEGFMNDKVDIPNVNSKVQELAGNKHMPLADSSNKPNAFPLNSDSLSSMHSTSIPNREGDKSSSPGAAFSIQDIQSKSPDSIVKDIGNNVDISSDEVNVSCIQEKCVNSNGGTEVGMKGSLMDSEDILSKSLELSGVSPEKEEPAAVLIGSGQDPQTNSNTHNSNVSGMHGGVLELDRRKEEIKGQLFPELSISTDPPPAQMEATGGQMGSVPGKDAGRDVSKVGEVVEPNTIVSPSIIKGVSEGSKVPTSAVNIQTPPGKVTSTVVDDKTVASSVPGGSTGISSALVPGKTNDMLPSSSGLHPEVKDKATPKILEPPMGNCPILKMSHDDIANALQRKIESLDKQLSNKVVRPTERRLRGRIRLNSGIGRPKVQKKVAKPLPICYMFTTRSRRKSIMVQPPQDLRRLCRRGGFLEVKEGFNYNTKNVGHFWAMPAPRPLFRFCWRYRLQTARSLSTIALLLRVLWSCMRWDDVMLKPLNYTLRSYSTRTEEIKETVVDKRDIPPTGLVSEFLFRKTIKPIEVDEDDSRETHKPQRSGLRSSSAPVKVIEEVKKPQGPQVVDEWRSEEKMQLWEIHQYCEKLRKDALAQANAEKKAQLQQQKAAEKAERAAEKKVKAVAAVSSAGQALAPAQTPLLTVGGKRAIKRERKGQQQLGMKTMSIEVLKSQLEEQLRKQKESMQQKRNQAASSSSTTTGVIPKLTLQAQARKKLKSAPVMMYTGPKASGSQSLILSQSPSGQTKVVYTPRGGISTPGQTGGRTATATTSPFMPGVRNVVIGGQRFPTPASATGQQQQQSLLTPKGQKFTIGGSAAAATPTGAGTGLSGTQLTGQAQVFTAQAQVVHVGGQKFVITPAQVQVQGSGQVIQAQLVQTTTPQGATIQRLVLTPNAQGQKVIPTIGAGGASTSGLPAATLPGVTQPQTVSLQAPIAPLHTPNAPLPTPSPVPQLPLATLQQQQQQQLRLQQQQILGGSAATLSSPVRAQVVNQLISRAGTSVAAPTNRLPTGGANFMAGTIPSALLSPTSTAMTVQQTAASLSTSDQVIQLQKKIQMQLQQLSSGGSSGEEPRTAQIPAITTASGESQLEQIARMQGSDEQLQEEYRLQMLRIQGKPEGSGRKRSDSRSSKEKKEQSRFREVTNLMKHMLEKIERDERKATKRKRKEQHREEKRIKITQQKRMLVLSKQRDSLRNEILIRRTLLEKRLTWDVREERALALKTAAEKARKRKAPRRRGPAPKKKPKAAATPATAPKKTPPKSPRGKPQQQQPAAQVPVPMVKQEVMEGPVPPESEAVQVPPATEILYCVCQTRYDASKFYVGCDMCLNWFHGSCVGVSEDTAKTMKDYICKECGDKKREREDELYCLCRQPYDETKFYIGCDKCNDWFHGACVGITQQEADVVEEYICPRCNSSNIQNVVASQKTLTTKDNDQLRRVVRQLESHKMGWPFLEPVSELDAADYYDIIKDPIDLSKISKKLVTKQYVKVNEFVADVSRMFDNCRLYNSSDSMFFQCADMLEKFFVQKMKNFKQ